MGCHLRKSRKIQAPDGPRGRIERFRVDGQVGYSWPRHRPRQRPRQGLCSARSRLLPQPASGVRHASRSLFPPDHGDGDGIVVPGHRRLLHGRRVSGEASHGNRGPVPFSSGCRSADLPRRETGRLAGDDGQPRGQWQCHGIVDRPGRRLGPTPGTDGHRREDERFPPTLVARRVNDSLPVQPHRFLAAPCRACSGRRPRTPHEHRHRRRGRRLEP